MTHEELIHRQESLRQEIVHLTFLTHGPDAAPFLSMPKDAPERALFTRMEEQLAEKKEQLHEIDTQIEQTSSPVSRFRETSRNLRGVIWFVTIFMLIVTLSFAMVWDDPTVKLLGAATLLMFLLALWSSFSSES